MCDLHFRDRVASSTNWSCFDDEPAEPFSGLECGTRARIGLRCITCWGSCDCMAMAIYPAVSSGFIKHVLETIENI